MASAVLVFLRPFLPDRSCLFTQLVHPFLFPITPVSFHQTDIVFLEREVKTRKQKFGVEVYDLMAQLEVDDGTSVEEKESKIRLAFDTARKDINVIQAKIDGKKEEMTKTEVVDAFASGTNGAPGVEIPADHQPAAATIVTD